MQISRLLVYMQCHWSIRKWYFSLILRSSTFVSIPHPVAPPPSSNGWYSVLATGVIAIPPSEPEPVHSVKVFNLVLQINTQTDDSTLLDIQTRLIDKNKCEISDCLNDTLTNPCGQKLPHSENNNITLDFVSDDIGFLSVVIYHNTLN